MLSASEVKITIGGIVSLTTIDYPGHLSAVIFCQGCPWACRYCHNKHLQTISQEEGLPFEEVLSLIDTRKNFIDAVVFSGGEPLIQDGLLDAIKLVKKRNLLIGLHTSGVLPERFAKIVGFLDWVGFDVKAPFESYQKIIQLPYEDKSVGYKVKESLDILLHARIDYEVRTSLDSSLTNEEVKDLLRELRDLGVQNMALQAIRNKDNELIPHPILSDMGAMDEFHKYFKNLIIRN